MSEENDFEVDVPPLSLFPSSKVNNSDDSDSEFEVPEREDLPSQNNQAGCEELPKADAQIKNRGFEENDALRFQPQILTPREKTSTDLTLQSENVKQSEFTKESIIEAPAEFADPEPPALQAASDPPQQAFSGISVPIPHIPQEKELSEIQVISVLFMTFWW